MADDLARLGIQWETQGAAEANAALEKTAQTAPKAEKATDDFAASQKRAATATQQFQKTMQRTALDMSRQFADVGVSLAMGINPLMILIQQGPQIADALQVASMSGVSFGDAMKGLGVQLGILRVVTPAVAVANDNLTASTTAAAVATAAMGTAATASTVEMGAATVAAGELAAANVAVAETATAAAAAESVALAPLAVLLGGVALVVGTATAGFALFHRELSKKYPKDITEGLNLTDAQLKRVKDRTVTFGDTLVSTFNVIGKHIMDGPVGKAIHWLGDLFSDTMDWIVGTAVSGTAKLYAYFVASYETITKHWRQLPTVFAVIITNAANLYIAGLEHMLNAARSGLNRFIEAVNHIPGVHVPEIDPISLGRLKTATEGAAGDIQKTFSDAAAKAEADFRRAAHNIADEIASGAIKRATDRALRQAGDAAKTREPKTRATTGHEENPLTAAAKGLSSFKVDETDLPKLADAWELVAGQADLATTRARLFADQMEKTADRVAGAAHTMADVFGPVGAALGGVLAATARYDAQIASIRAKQTDQLGKLNTAEVKFGLESVEAAKERAKWAQVNSDAIDGEKQARVDAYGAMLDAASGFFDKSSDGYRFMQAASAAYHAFEAAQTIQSMVLDATKTASSVANSATRATADTAAGGAKMFSQLGVYAFPAVAAMLAVMTSLGATSGGSAGSMPGAHDAEDRQARQGAGSILGDAKAKSDSIAHSLEIVASNTNHDLEYSNQMLKALRSIDNQIGAVAAAVGRSLGVGGTLDTSNLGLGTSVQGPSGLTKLLNPLSWALPGLFGSKTTTTLQDLGVQFNPQTIAQIVASGISGSTYQQTSTEKKKKFLGITYSDKTSVNTATGALDADFVRQTQLLIGSLRDGVVEAASVLGVQGAAATLNAFKLNLGKLSFKDMSADEIQKTLENVFSKAADDMAHAVMPVLSQFQQAGEGQFETLTRLAREYQVVDTAMQAIDKTFGAVGVGSIAARDRLVQLMGGLDDFTSATSAYADAFLTDAQRIAPIQAAVTKELQRLGIATDISRSQFADLVSSVDVTSEAGAQLFASLMNLAPALDKVLSYSESLDNRLSDTDLAQKRRELEIDLMDAQGRSLDALNAQRADELAGMDDRLRALQMVVWAEQDRAQRISDARDTLSTAYSRESTELEATISRLSGYRDALAQFRSELSTGPSAVQSLQAQYRAQRLHLDKVAGLAIAGDETAMGQIKDAGTSFLSASRSAAATLQDYMRDRAHVLDLVGKAESSASSGADLATQQLDQLKASVTGLIDINDSVISVHDAIIGLQTAMAPAPTEADFAPPAAPAPMPVVIQSSNDNNTADAVDALREEVTAGNMNLLQIMLNTSSGARQSEKLRDLLERLSEGGDALRTTVVA